MSRARRSVLFGAAVAGLACGGSARSEGEGAGAVPAPTPEAVPAPPADLRRCKPGAGATGSPATIDEAVALINSLPFPVTAPCVIEALDRPLQVEATHSSDSVQPAVGERSPRVFIWPAESLVLAVALAGKGQRLIELGQFVSPDRSVKAEIEFPLSEPVTVDAALQRVRNPEHPEITSCFVCHDLEEDEATIPGGRSSLAIRPSTHTLVDVASLAGLREDCDAAAEPGRCAWLEALVDHGPVEHHPFDRRIHRF